MAGNIKGITIQFRGDTTQLDKAINQVKRESNALAKELRDVENALKFNPGNTELLAQKQKLLTDRVDQTSKALEDLKKAQKELDDKGVDKNSAEYRKLQREIITTDSKLKKFTGDLQKFNAQQSKVYRMGKAFQDAGKKIEGAGQKLRGVSRAAAVVTAALGAVTVKAGQMADDLNTLSKQTGISTDRLQMYAASADLVDVSVESMAKSQQRLKKSMLSASQGKSQLKYFEQLGVSVTDADGNLRDAQDVFDDTIIALGKMENETERDAVAMALMGKSASDLNPLIEDGGETYKKVSKMLKKYGLEPVTQEDLDRANEFQDQIDTIKLVLTQAIQIVGTKIAGYVVPLMEKVVKGIAKIAQYFGGLSGEVLTKIMAIAAALAALSPVLIVVGKLVGAVGKAVQTATSLVGGLSKAFTFLAANPIVLVIAGITALVAAFVILWNKSEAFRNFFIGIWDAIKKKINEFKTGFQEARQSIAAEIDKLKAKATEVRDKFTDAKDRIVSAFKAIPDKFREVWNSIGTGLKNLGGKVADAVTGSIKSGINAVITTVENIINKAIALVNSAIALARKLPGLKNLGSVSPVSLPRLAQGGVLYGAQTVIAGEAGPEAIVPLDRLFKQMDKMAATIAGSGEGGGVTVNVYGAAGQDVNELAAAVEQRIIALQKRRAQAWA